MLNKLLNLKRVLCLLGIFACLNVYSQQDAMYTQYMFNTLMYNPAYAGTADAISAAAIYRHQWADFDGAPRTVSMYAHGPVRDKYGLGLDLQYDTWGVHKWMLMRTAYSYKFYVTPRAKVSIGLDASLLYQRSGYSDVTTYEEDQAFQENVSRIFPNFGFGLYYYSNRHYVGFSIPNILNNKLSALSSDAQLFRHYYLTGGLVIPLSRNLKLKPAILVKSVGSFAPTEADFTLQLFIMDALWTGLAYRTGDSVDFLFGFNLGSSIRVGYAFDFITTEIKNHTSWHTHEIMLSYDFNLRNQRVITPRYF